MPFSMDPPFTPEHDLFRRTLRDYVVKELQPHALEWDEAGIFPREVFNGMAETRLRSASTTRSRWEARAATTGTWWCWPRS